MKKKLTHENVEFIVVHASSSTVHQDLTVDEVLKKRVREGYPDIGFHYVITRDGKLNEGIPISEAGTHTARFDTCSIGVLMVGGKTTRGRPSDNYTKEQKETLKSLLNILSANYTAKVVGVGQLLGGTSPHFNLEELQHDTSRQSSEASQKA